jgi:putative membrane protein
MKFLIKIFVSGVAAFLTAMLLFPHVRIGYGDKPDFVLSLFLAVVLSFLNNFLKPVLLILTVPITLFTFGIFLLFINAIILYVATLILPDFQIDSLWWAVLFSFILSFITSLLERILGTRDNQNRMQND